MPPHLGVKQGDEHTKGQLPPSLDLRAMADAAAAPVAEVLAVIGQQAIVVLADARASASHDLFGRIRWPVVIDDLYGVANGKSRQRYLLDGAALPKPGKT